MLDAISMVSKNGNDYYNFEDIYEDIASLYDQSPSYVKWAIKYIIDNRNISLSEKNFEKIFGYEYNEYSFTNKELIQEIARVIQYELYNK